MMAFEIDFFCKYFFCSRGTFVFLLALNFYSSLNKAIFACHIRGGILWIF